MIAPYARLCLFALEVDDLARFNSTHVMILVDIAVGTKNRPRLGQAVVRIAWVSRQWTVGIPGVVLGRRARRDGNLVDLGRHKGSVGGRISRNLSGRTPNQGAASDVVEARRVHVRIVRAR